MNQCTMPELAIVLSAFNKVADAFDDAADCSTGGPFKSAILNDVIYSLPGLKKPMKDILGAINMKELENNKKTNLWTDWDRHAEIEDAKMVRLTQIRCRQCLLKPNSACR